MEQLESGNALEMCGLWLLKYEEKNKKIVGMSFVTPVLACSHMGTAEHP